MKTWFNYLIMAGLALTTLAACEKEGDRLTIASTATPPTLTSSAASVSLTSANAANEALRLNWTSAQYGFNAPVQYTVQIDTSGTFAAPVTISAGSSTSLSISGTDLNQDLIKLGRKPGKTSPVAVRVMAQISRPGSDANNTIYSTATTVTATPYQVIVSYPSLYVPGAYQSWAPQTAPAIVSVTNNKMYEGYVYFGTASEFKFTSAPNWDNTNYGTAGAAGALSTDGGAKNLSVATPGYYLLKADVNALTYSAAKTDWAIIGAATPNGWGTETPMTFDPTTNTWRITLDLKADEFKFRANNAWDINFGDTGADGLLEYGGDNIKAPAAGKYLVILNLSNGGRYTYTLTKA